MISRILSFLDANHIGDSSQGILTSTPALFFAASALSFFFGLWVGVLAGADHVRTGPKEHWKLRELQEQEGEKTQPGSYADYIESWKVQNK